MISEIIEEAIKNILPTEYEKCIITKFVNNFKLKEEEKIRLPFIVWKYKSILKLGRKNND